MLSKYNRIFGVLVAVVSLTLAGCIRSGTRADISAPEYSSSEPIIEQQISPVDSFDVAFDDSTVTGGSATTEIVVAGEDFEGEIHRLFAEAEQYYALGVQANQEAEWAEAQYNFEKATEILATIDLANVEQPDMAEKFDILLREVASDYQFALASMGGLSSEASMAAFFLRFESLENLRDFQETMPVEQKPAEIPEVKYDIPIELNDEVKNCIVYFQTVARKPFETYLKRSGRYIPLMSKIIAEYGLPSDLVYLPLIESGFNPKAYSYAHASGPWQFIASTGRSYGMNRSWWRDERRDFVKSTHAACKYLKYLYEMFDCWSLALASYNGGEGRVGRQIKRQKTRDFWKLRLRKQTRNYVPLYMAATMIAKEPERFGFAGIDYDPPVEFDLVTTDKPLELKVIARRLNVSADELKALNPELLRGVTPPGEEDYLLRVPAGLGPKFSAVYDDLPESSRAQWTRHRVNKGETISTIARRYGISQGALVDANKLRSRHRIYVGQVLTVPVPPNQSSSSSPSRVRDRTVNSDGKYFVRRGETLWELSRDFSVSISALRKANGMRPNDKLLAGQWIKIPGREGSGTRTQWYTVKSGDTVWGIAGHFGVKVKDILAVNNLRNPRRIHPGTKIRIP
ncbi:LysM peptidoglycan-binding domain-containing protein [Candidatus Zixiibacteriota bacterium]